MGFRKSIYQWENSIPNQTIYTGEGIYDFQGTRYFLLLVNDYQHNHGTSIISPFKEDMLSDNNILAKLSTDCCKTSSCCEHVERKYFGPVNLTKLEIKFSALYFKINLLFNKFYNCTCLKFYKN